MTPEEHTETNPEIAAYSSALDRAHELLEQGLPHEALAELNRLDPPQTDDGRELWPVLGIVKRSARAMMHFFDGELERGTAEFRAVLMEAPEAEEFEEIRAMARSWVLFMEKSPDLSEDEVASLHPSVLPFLSYQLALQDVASALTQAAGSMVLGDEAGYGAAMNLAGRAGERANAELPTARPFTEAVLGLGELEILTLRQQRDLESYEFHQVERTLHAIKRRASDLSSQMDSVEGFFVPLAWVHVMANSVAVVAEMTNRTAVLLRHLVSHSAGAQHLKELTAIAGGTREAGEALRDVRAPGFAEPLRQSLLTVASRLAVRANRLKSEIRPSRLAVLNITGLVSAVCFVAVTAALLLIGRVTDAQLDGTLVLSLSALFGLVGGFGYGALKFRGFLTSILFGRRGDEDAAGQAQND